MKLVHLTREISPEQREWRNDPAVYAFTRQNGLISQAHHERYWQSLQNDKSIEAFGVENNIGQAVGTTMLTSIRYEHGTAEFSLLIAPHFQKQGYGKAALIELLLYGFNHLRLQTIFGETFEFNPAYAMFLKLGFQYEGTLRQRYFKNGKHVDSKMVSITKQEALDQPWYSTL